MSGEKLSGTRFFKTAKHRKGGITCHLSRALVAPELGPVGHSLTGPPRASSWEMSSPSGLQSVSEIYEKDSRLATADHACKDITSCLARAFH